MGVIDSIRTRAKQNKKTIVLPEGFDERVVKAAVIAAEEGFANTVLLGKKEDIEKLGIDVSAVAVVDPATSDKRAEYANALYEIRKNKGMTIEEALTVTNKKVVETLEGLPPQKIHCSVLAEEAINLAIEDYKSKQA